MRHEIAASPYAVSWRAEAEVSPPPGRGAKRMRR
jgi:hypothetical protein